MENDLECLKARILYKLARRRMWGGKHTDIAHLHTGVPSHFRKESKRAANELIKEGLIIQKRTEYGLHVSLNPRKKTEIESIIREYFAPKNPEPI